VLAVVYLVLFLRSFGGCVLISLGSPGAAVAGVSELLSCALGLVNHLRARRRDRSWYGLLVPCCYVAGGLLAPSAPHWIADAWLFVVGLATIFCLAYLGDSLSVAQPTFVRLVDSGPFAWCRHPLAGLHVLMACTICAAWPSWLNLVGACACLVLAWLSTELEERFLRKVAAGYEAYAQRVRWRLLPGVY
jgi:protein-S-isoprenylcysteine O-methyltransferase Ste14